MCITEIFYEVWTDKSRSKPTYPYLSPPKTVSFFASGFCAIRRFFSVSTFLHTHALSCIKKQTQKTEKLRIFRKKPNFSPPERRLGKNVGNPAVSAGFGNAVLFIFSPGPVPPPLPSRGLWKTLWKPCGKPHCSRKNPSCRTMGRSRVFLHFSTDKPQKTTVFA